MDRYIPDLHDLYDLYDLYGLYDLAHVVGWEQHILYDLQHIVPGLDLYYTDPAQHLITAGQDLDDLDHDLPDLSDMCKFAFDARLEGQQ